MRKILLTAVTLLVTLWNMGCDQNPLAGANDSSNSNESVDNGNLAEGQFAAGNTEDVNLSAPSGSEVEGAGIVFPPGSLKLDTTVSIGEGGSLATDSTSAELGIEDNSISSAGPAVVFNSTADFNADEGSPFQLQLPISGGSSLRLAACANLVVVYKQKRAVEGGEPELFIGLFKGDQLTIDTESVTVTTRYFGAYQAACAEKEITEDIKPKRTIEPIVQKIKSLPYVGTWLTGCQSRDRGGDDNGGGDNGNSDGSGSDNSDGSDDDSFSADDQRAIDLRDELNITPEYLDRVNSVRQGDDGQDQESERVVFTLTRDSFSYRAIEYYGSNCEIPAKAQTFVGKLTVNGDAEGLEETKKVDIDLAKATMRTISRLDQFNFRYQIVCGTEEWAPEKVVDITDRSKCPKIFNDDNDGGPQKGVTYKTLLQVKGDELRLGEDENGDGTETERDAEGYPVKLEERFMKRG